MEYNGTSREKAQKTHRSLFAYTPSRCAFIAVIDDPRVVEKILRHLGAWHDPPPRPPPQGLPGPYTYEPCDDVDPAPDYENVLTD